MERKVSECTALKKQANGKFYAILQFFLYILWGTPIWAGIDPGGGLLSMMSEHDIWCVALSMIGRYGADAASEAGERADALTAKGMIDDSETWQRILFAIIRLQEEKPAPGETVH